MRGLSLGAIGFLVALSAIFSSCKIRSPQKRTAPLKGLSASADAENVALLMTAYSYTPEHGGFFETDMEQFRRVVTDPAGHYNFKTMIDQRVGHYQILANFKKAASLVSNDGTLLVFITAHGSQGGRIQPEDQGYATIGYPEMLAAIREGRGGKPFRRLVLFVSACYSGSWLNTLQSSNGLFQERLVITSVGENSLSWIAEASRGMLNAFTQLKGSNNATLADLIAQTQRNVGNVLYSAVPQTMMAEPLVNAKKSDTKPAKKPEIEKNTNQDGVDKDITKPDVAATTMGEVSAITVNDPRGGVQFYVYSATQVSKIEMQTTQGWWAMPDLYDPQPNIATIYGAWSHVSYATLGSIHLRLTLMDGSTVEKDVAIEHR